MRSTLHPTRPRTADDGRRNPHAAVRQPSGVQLLVWLQENLRPILRRESDNARSIHLYAHGDYSNAFELSAYRLACLVPDARISVLRLPAHPFPILMASVPTAALRPLLDTHIPRSTHPDHVEILTAETNDEDAYRAWRREREGE